MKTAASYEITKIRVNPAGGEIEELYINHEKVDMGEETLQDNKTATIDASTYTEPVEITPSSGKVAMKKATVTVSNIPVIEANKAASVDVSTYTEAVEVTPTEGKDGMAKATVTLSNIPQMPDLDLLAYRYSMTATGEDTLTFFSDTNILLHVTPDTSVPCDGYIVSGSSGSYSWEDSGLTVNVTDDGGIKYTATYNDVTYTLS